jgi:hypothetical protein
MIDTEDQIVHELFSGAVGPSSASPPSLSAPHQRPLYISPVSERTLQSVNEHDSL